MQGEAAQDGFTLLEVIVALAIATLALGGLFAGAATGLRASHLAGDTMAAVSLARSHLAALGHGVALVPGTQSGDDGGSFHWQLRIVQLGDIPQVVRQGAPVGPPGRTVLLAIAVAVSWTVDGGERRVQLDTQRVGEAAPARP